MKRTFLSLALTTLCINLPLHADGWGITVARQEQAGLTLLTAGSVATFLGSWLPQHSIDPHVLRTASTVVGLGALYWYFTMLSENSATRTVQNLEKKYTRLDPAHAVSSLRTAVARGELAFSWSQWASNHELYTIPFAQLHQGVIILKKDLRALRRLVLFLQEECPQAFITQKATLLYVHLEQILDAVLGSNEFTLEKIEIEKELARRKHLALQEQTVHLQKKAPTKPTVVVISH